MPGVDRPDKTCMHFKKQYILRMKILQEGKTLFQKSQKNRRNYKVSKAKTELVQCATADICRTGSTACLGGEGEMKIPSHTGPTKG
jgi:hypothetical protein